MAPLSYPCIGRQSRKEFPLRANAVEFYRLECRMILTRCRKARCYCNPLTSLKPLIQSGKLALYPEYSVLASDSLLCMWFCHPQSHQPRGKLSHFLKLLGHSRPQGSQQPDIHLLGTITTPLLPLLKSNYMPGNMTGTLYMMCQFIKQT